MAENNIKLVVDTTELDIALEKANQLVSALEKAQSIIESLGCKTINNYANTD